MLDIIERLVIMAGYVYLRLDGSTKQQDRQAKVDQFNSSASVFLFLISTTAGGLGLNLTAANRSVLFLTSDSAFVAWNGHHVFYLLHRVESGLFWLKFIGANRFMHSCQQLFA